MKVSPPTPPPFPIPASQSVLKFPADHYLHPGAPTEWWWHMGTLKAGDRIFGFEINAASFNGIAFTQTMLTDVNNNVHYKKTRIYDLDPDWAEADPSQPWHVQLGKTTDSTFVTMDAPQSDPSRNMVVKAVFVDETTDTIVKFSLTLSQEGPPFIVFGTGVNPTPEVPGGVVTNNYYYSFTRLHTSGTVIIGDNEPIAVEGLTWMDHEYGLFGDKKNPVKWFLQDMQLNNGVHISHFAIFTKTAPAALDVPTPSHATVQFPDGTTYFEHDCTLTPTGRTWKSPTGRLFFLEFKVEIPSFAASFTVISLVDDQDLPFPFDLADTYEGIASASGTFMGHAVHGTAWNEQQP